jgi:colanic acid/amylovoran biosynthesis glycosyltransferase
MKLRLGYLVPEFPGQTHVFFWREIRALRRKGEDVLLLSTRKPPEPSRHDFAAIAMAETNYLFPPAVLNIASWTAVGRPGLKQAHAYLSGLEPSGFTGRVRQYALLASAVGLIRWARLERVDHIHGHSCADAAHVLAIARRMGGPPYSLTLHGDLAIYGADHRSKMERAAFVSVVGGHLRRQVEEQVGIPSERILETCMGVEVTALTALGKNRSYAPGSLHLVTVARLIPAKGHVHALSAVRRGLEAGLDLRYTIAGDGPYREDLLSVVCRLDLESRVTFTGTLPEEEVFQLLSKADAFVLPSVGLGEAWPVSVMEAMGAGLPVIVSSIGATPEMIISGEDGFLVPQRDEQLLFEHIEMLANDPETRRRVGSAARRTALRRFNVETTATVLRDMIRASLQVP